MRNLINQVEVIDFYFSKIEDYMSRKHRNSLLKAGAAGNDLGSDSSSNLSGSPRSGSLSDRQNTMEMSNEIEMEEMSLPQSQSDLKNSGRFEFPEDSETETKVETRRIERQTKEK